MNKRKVVKQNVGLDISKDDFKICYYHQYEDFKQVIKGTRRFKNTLTAFREFLKWVDKRSSTDVLVRITLEATGVYYEQLVHFLKDKTDYHISVVLPNKSKSFAKSYNIKTKTDSVDAKILGIMGLERDLKAWQPPSPKLFTIKQLSRDRIALTEEKVALMNKLHALNHSFEPNNSVIKRMTIRLKLIKKQLMQVETELKKAVKKDPELSERIDKVCKVKGLGFITVATIIAETNGFELFTSRAQLTSYAGYDVVENQSGSSVRGKQRISKKGNRFIRRALHFPALSARKYEPQFKNLYERVLERTAIKMKACVAVQRKLLLLIYTLFTKNIAYDPNYQN
ncbi:hypothetical protein AB834_00435 [PVC group bacterium (ex Bugula neritina AB1)]|nr:hypothetical protein AB834_00435 [PVC group bacterium (ex Bugula neritina AB1)]